MSYATTADKIAAATAALRDATADLKASAATEDAAGAHVLDQPLIDLEGAVEDLNDAAEDAQPKHKAETHAQAQTQASASAHANAPAPKAKT